MNLGELFNLGDILWHVFNTVLLFVGLRLLLYRPVRKFMDGRNKRIKDQQDKANDLLKEAQEKEESAKQLVLETTHKAEQMIEESTLQAQQQAQEILKEAEEKAKEIIDQAHQEAAIIKLENMEAMQDQAIDLAIDISSKLLKREISASDHKDLIDELLQKVN